MKRFLSILILIVACANVQAQNQQKLDSLLQALEISKADSSKVNLLIKISRAHLRTDPEKAREFAASAVKTATKLEFIRGIGAGYLATGVAYFSLRNIDSALINYEQSVKYFAQCNYRRGLTDVYENIGDAFSDYGEFDKAHEVLIRALNICENDNDLVKQAEVLNSIGSNYKRLVNLEKAAEYALRSLSLRRQLGERRNIAVALNNIAAIYTDMQEHRKALRALGEAVMEADSVNDQDVILVCKINMSNNYVYLGEFDKALKYVQHCLHSYMETGNKLRMTACLGIIANIHLEKGNYKKSVEFTLRSIDYAQEIDDREHIKSGYWLLQEAYDSLGDYKQALRILQKLMVLKDDIFEGETQSLVAEMEAKYEIEKKDKLNALLREEKARAEARANQNLFTALGVSGLLIAMMVIVFLYTRQRKARERQLNVELEQKALRSQMNPHFISNSLMAIQSYIYKKDPKQAGKYLASFAKLMRLILENSREEYISLEREIKTLEYYLELQALRFENKFDYQINAAPELDVEAIAVPPMLAQPFIENALEHGIRQKETGGEVNVRFNLEGELIRLEVKDNGIGRQRSEEQKQDNKNAHQSLSTTITQERLAILNKKNKQKIKLEITDLRSSDGEVTGTRATFHIPYRNV